MAIGFAGASTSTPFGQSSFGKITNTSGFGSTAFGATSTPMFGGQNQTQTGLFASTTPGQGFGQPAQPQSGFGKLKIFYRFVELKLKTITKIDIKYIILYI